MLRRGVNVYPVPRCLPAEFVVGHPHVGFVRLRQALGRIGPQLRGGRGPLDRQQAAVAKSGGGPNEQPLQVTLRDGPDGVEVGGRAVVLGHVPAQRDRPLQKKHSRGLSDCPPTP